MYQVDLNSDLGESFGAYTIGLDQDVIAHVSSANIACGYHAGDPLVMDRTVAACKAAGVAVGAHPGYPDLMGFGRRNMVCSPKEVKAYIQYQMGALLAFTAAHGVKLQHCKPHGALYNMAGKDMDLAIAIADGARNAGAPLYLSAAVLGTDNPRFARQLIRYTSQFAKGRDPFDEEVASEVFADRAYQADGSLVPRSKPGAVIHDKDEAISRTIRMVTEGRVTAITGEEVSIEAHSICVHGDNPSAVEFVKNIRAKLEGEGVAVAPIAQIV